MPVQSPPPATCANMRAHCQLPAIATTTNTTAAAAMGSPLRGTTWIFGRSDGSLTLGAGATPRTVSVMSTFLASIVNHRNILAEETAFQDLSSEFSRVCGILVRG